MPAITAPALGSDTLPRDVTGMIFERAEAGSAVQALAPNEPLPSNGAAIPTLTGEPVAAWVAEGGRKPVSTASTGVKLLDPKKLAVIVAFSDEFLRTDRTNLPDTLRTKIANAFAQAFDRATIHGDSGNSPFTTYLSSTTNKVEIGTNAAAAGGLHQDVIDGLQLVVDDDYTITGFAAAPQIEPGLLGARDANGQPILVSAGAGGVSSLIGRPLTYGKGVYTATNVADTDTDGIRMVGGEWSQTAWGAFGDISFSVSDQATLVDSDNTTLIHLWQNNLVGLRAEAFYGWVVADTDAFVRYVDNS